MELNLKILALLLQCTSIYRCALFITSKNNINFLFYVHITFFIFYSFFISFSVSLSSLPLHLFFLPPDLLSIIDLISPAADPFLHYQSHKPNCYRPFSPLPISQAQMSTLFSIANLTSPAADPFLHRRYQKLSRHRPFSPSPISQAQPPQTLPFRFALISFRSRRTKPRRWLRNWAVSIS